MGGIARPISASRSRTNEDKDVKQFARDNPELLSRILANGDSEARGYALAVIANGATVETIDKVQAELDEIRRQIQ